MTEKKGMHKTVTIGGVEYKFQKLIPSQWLALKKRIKNKNGMGIDEAKLMDELLEHVVVSPRIGVDDLDWAELDELTTKALEFQTGGGTF